MEGEKPVIERKRMSPAVRDELIVAIRERRIGNATTFANEFAERHGLNASTVRAAISRYRARFGLLERSLRYYATPALPEAATPASTEAEFSAQIMRLCEMSTDELAAVRARMVRQQEWIAKAIGLVDALHVLKGVAA